MGTAQRHQQTFGLRDEKLNMGLKGGGVGREGEREGEGEGARMMTVGSCWGNGSPVARGQEREKVRARARGRREGKRAGAKQRERGKGHRHLDFVPFIAMPQDTIRLVCRDPTYLCESRAQCVGFVLG